MVAEVVAEEESVLVLDPVVGLAVVPVVDLQVVDPAVDPAVGQVQVQVLGRAPVAAQVPGRAGRSRRRVTG